MVYCKLKIFEPSRFLNQKLIVFTVKTHPTGIHTMKFTQQRKFYIPTVLVVVCGMLIALLGCSQDSLTSESHDTPMTEMEQPIEWKLVTTWPKNLPALGVAPERFADLVSQMSAGRLTIKVYGANEMVGAMEVFDAVSNGSAQMGHGAAYYWVGKIPVSALFTTVPFGMNAQEMNAWLAYGGGNELWKELYEPFNLIPLPGGNSGVQMGGWFNVEINSINDLQGLKMRIPGIAGEVMTRAGVATVTLPPTDIFTSLQTGVIDATEWVGPYNDLALALYDAAKYYYYPGWHEPCATIEFLINQDAFQSLTPDLQKIVEVAARAINQDVLDEFTAKNNASLRALIEEHEVELRQFPDDVLIRLREISNEVLDELAETSEHAQKIVDSYRTFQAEVREWSKISEDAYLRARELQ